MTDTNNMNAITSETTSRLDANSVASSISCLNPYWNTAIGYPATPTVSTPNTYGPNTTGIGNGSIYNIPSYPAPRTLEQQEEWDTYENKRKLIEAELKEKIDALKSFFPRAHPVIKNLDVMIDIAREDQLNPLYESTLKEFEEAQLAMSRAANKLASAVKLTDSEEIEKRSMLASNFLDPSILTNNYGYHSLSQANGPLSTVSIASTQTVTPNTNIAGPLYTSMGYSGSAGIAGPTGTPGPVGPANGFSSIQTMWNWLFKKYKYQNG